MTPEIIEREREAFKEWYINYLPPDSPIQYFSRDYTGYRTYRTRVLFEGWLARASQSEWISVKDRLPGIGEFVLVFRSWDGKLSQRVDRLELHHDCEKPEGEQDWYDFLYSDIYEVTHWQPLPAPPTVNPAA